MVRLYLNQDTQETTADYGQALEWAEDGITVSEYHKETEFGGSE